MDDINKKFSSVFEVVRASTPALLDKALRLRHQVYCVENQYESPSSCGDKIEFDKFDLFSAHSIVRHRLTGQLTANVRLVLPRSDQTDFHFPIQELIPSQLIENELGTKFRDRSTFAEISRFCVSKEFKHCLAQYEKEIGKGLVVNPQLDLLEAANGDRRLTSSLDVTEECRLLPHITVALFAAIFKMSAEEGIENWFAVMEPPLLRFLSRYGIKFKPIGDVISYKGLRQPCFANADEVALGIWQKRPDIWRFVTKNGEVWPLMSYRGSAKTMVG